MEEITARLMIWLAEMCEEDGEKDKTRFGMGLVHAANKIRMFVRQNYQPNGTFEDFRPREKPIDYGGSPFGLQFKLCVFEGKPTISISQNGFSSGFMNLKKFTEWMIPFMENNYYDREEAIQIIATYIDCSPREYDHDLLGKAGDKKLENEVLEIFDMKPMSDLGKMLYGVY